MERFLAAQITDLHIKAAGKLSYRVVDTAGFLRRCVEQVLKLPQRPDCVLLTGDLTDFGRPQEYAELRKLLAPLTMPCYLIPGNHDDRDNMRAAFSHYPYMRQHPQFIQYAIEDWPLRILALDTVIPQESGGELCAARLEWLERELARKPQQPTLVIMHHPPFTTFIGHMDDIGLKGGEALARIIAKYDNVERVLCGHLHRPIETRYAGTIASTCPSPAHQVVLDLARDAASNFVMEPPAFQLHLWTPQAGVVSHTAYVGTFDGPYPFREEGELID